MFKHKRTSDRFLELKEHWITRVLKDLLESLYNITLRRSLNYYVAKARLALALGVHMHQACVSCRNYCLWLSSVFLFVGRYHIQKWLFSAHFMPCYEKPSILTHWEAKPAIGHWPNPFDFWFFGIDCIYLQTCALITDRIEKDVSVRCTSSL